MGCVWPVDINEREEIRQPPELDWSMISPIPEMQVNMDPEGGVTFSVEGAVFDPDNDPNQLQYAWFLDYPVNCEEGNCYPAWSKLPGQETLVINQCAQEFKSKLGIGAHLLELIVTDGEVNFDSSGITITGGFATVSWWLDVEEPCPL